MDLDTWLATRGGVVQRAELLARGVDRAEIRRRFRSGDWHPLFRGIVATHLATGSPAQIRCRGALAIGGADAYLSCLGAAMNRGLPLPADSAVHISVPLRRTPSERHGFRAHRDAMKEAPSAYAGLPTVGVETALIQAFGCLGDETARRALVIDSIRGRLVAPDRVALAAVGVRTGRRSELLDLVAVCQGSQSEAEIAMLRGVVRAAGLPEPVRQHAITVHHRNYRVDLAYPAALLAIEVDGKAWHFNAERRTADIRRDAELASVGWLTLRFTYEQITNESEWVSGCVAAALTTRCPTN